MSEPNPYCRAFVAEAKRLLAAPPAIEHTWSIKPDESSCTLTIPAVDGDGFEIRVQVGSDEALLSCGGFHGHEPYEDAPEEFAGHFVGFLYDLLTPLMRVREERAGGSGYKWMLECWRGDSWENRGTMGLLFFKYWGKRSERVYQNHVLPLREDPLLS
jgi:hypothetical protein